MTSDASPAPADPEAGQPGWTATLYAVWAGQLLALIGFSSRASFLPFYLGDLGVTDVDGQALWSGAINAAGAGVMAVSAPIWGILADRYGRKPMLLRGLFGGAVTAALMGLAVAPWQLLALRMLEGGLTGTVAAATALVAASAPRKRLGYALGMVQTAVFAGASAGPLFGGFVYDRFGARAAFELGAVMLFTGGMLVAFFVRERFSPMARHPLENGDGDGRWRRFRTSGAFLFTGAMLTMLAAIFVIRMIAMSMQPIIPLFVQELAPDNAEIATVAGIVLGAAGFTSALAAAYLGRLGDRLGHRRVLAVSLLAAGLIYLPMAIVRDPWQLAVLQALMGIAAGGMIPSANALVAHLSPPERRGAVFGLTAALSGFGGFIGPLLGAGLATSLGFRSTFVAAGALLLAMAALVIWSQHFPTSRDQVRAPGAPAG